MPICLMGIGFDLIHFAEVFLGEEIVGSSGDFRPMDTRGDHVCAFLVQFVGLRESICPRFLMRRYLT